jgi:hypothetical protein
MLSLATIVPSASSFLGSIAMDRTRPQTAPHRQNRITGKPGSHSLPPVFLCAFSPILDLYFTIIARESLSVTVADTFISYA